MFEVKTPALLNKTTKCIEFDVTRVSGLIVARAIAGVLTIRADGSRDGRLLLLLLGERLGLLAICSMAMPLTEGLVTWREKKHQIFLYL